MILTRRLTSATATLVLTASLGLVVAAGPAQAAAPVTTPDAVSLVSGGFAEVRVLDNDSDADGDELAICRLGNETYKKVGLDFISGGPQDGLAVVFSRPKAKPGTYTFTYYVCDYETLVPGTLTVTIEPRPRIAVKALPGRPGKIKVTNPADFKVRFLWGSMDAEKPDGALGIRRESSAIVEVRRTEIVWVAFSPRGLGLGFVDFGTVENIKLPPGTTPPPSGDRIAPRAVELWKSWI